MVAITGLCCCYLAASQEINYSETGDLLAGIVVADT